MRSLAEDAEAPPILHAPLLDAFASPGKRVRGTLTLAVAAAFGAKWTRLIDAACAFEMIHTSSLILDDLPAMDDASIRRGRPAHHRAHGEDLAILTAVALLNHAFGRVADAWSLTRPRKWNLATVLSEVVTAVGWNGSIGGEAVDLHSEDRELDFQTLEYIHSRKTGALFVASAVVGAMLANASEQALMSIRAYAKNLGLAFQITDDILDMIGTPEGLGKNVGQDRGKLTFVRLAGVDGARELNRELIDTAVQALEPLGKKGETLVKLALMLRDRNA